MGRWRVWSWCEVGEEGEVCGADFAEAEAGVEDDLIAREAGGGGGGDALRRGR